MKAQHARGRHVDHHLRYRLTSLYAKKVAGPKIVFSDTKCAVDFVKRAVDFAGVCYVK